MKTASRFESLLRENGIIWNSSTHHISGHTTYGPWGKKFKNNVVKHLQDWFDKQDYHEVETPIVLHKKVWEKSGHWNNFTDPVVKIKNKEFRVDHLIKKHFSNVNYDTLSKTEVQAYVDKISKILQTYISSIGEKNMMMTTTSGNQQCALRPETATSTYMAFDNLYNFYKKATTIQVYQIGKAFRNEISPKNFTLRTREFTQAEAQYIVHPDFKTHSLKSELDELLPVSIDGKLSYQSMSQLFTQKLLTNTLFAKILFETFGMVKELFKRLVDKDPKSIHQWLVLKKHSKSELAFYALDAWDIEMNLPGYGWTEIMGIHDRGDYDLTQQGTKVKPVPHIIETAIGVDRLIFALLVLNYDVGNAKKSKKSVLRIPYYLAPIQVAILPLVRKEKFLIQAAKIYAWARGKHGHSVVYMTEAAIGKRYLRCGLLGIPKCITIDGQTLDDGTVTIRDRDTEKQIRKHLVFDFDTVVTNKSHNIINNTVL